MKQIDWNKTHIYKIGVEQIEIDEEVIDENESKKYRKSIEPWLSSLFQSEHLSLLIGSGLTTGVCFKAKTNSRGMSTIEWQTEFKEKIKKRADETAKDMGRGESNIEDEFRIAFELLAGLRILRTSEDVTTLENEVINHLNQFIKGVLKAEADFLAVLGDTSDKEKRSNGVEALNYLKSFILSFSSRVASRERLNIFTTNYDRFIEKAADEIGLLLLDRFRGQLEPIFRNTRLDLDYHYNPPGIRGEPRYVEGVARITKLHGSIDWRFKDEGIKRVQLPFGANEDHPEAKLDHTYNSVIYPNSSKDIETAFYPYAELFRDLSASICRPNSVLVTYGYGFGDSHINRVLEDMLTIPSTHLLIIAFDTFQTGSDLGARERLIKFLENKNSAQISLLIGSHFGDLTQLVDNYLPKSAIDRITIRMQKFKDSRGDVIKEEKNENGFESQAD